VPPSRLDYYHHQASVTAGTHTGNGHTGEQQAVGVVGICPPSPLTASAVNTTTIAITAVY